MLEMQNADMLTQSKFLSAVVTMTNSSTINQAATINAL